MSAGITPEQKELAGLSERELAAKLRETTVPAEAGDLLAAAAERIERFGRFTGLVGLLAPAGTAPRTALEQIYVQSAELGVEESPIILELRGMLANHWGDWTPAIAEAEGITPAVKR